MKRTLLPLSLVAVVTAGFLVGRFLGSGETTRRSLRPPVQIKTQLKEIENPQDRIAYEVERLKDPKTGRIPAGVRTKELTFAATLPSDDGMYFGKGGMRKTQGGLTWTQRGPWNVGGRTRALAIDVSNENNILAGGVSGGMWRSTTGGTTWTKTTQPLQHQAVSCLAQDKRGGKQNIWYYGTGEGSGNSASGSGAFFLGDGIFKSTDSGQSWTQLAATVNNTPQSFNSPWEIVYNMATDPSNAIDDEVYAAAFGAIMRSTNGGTTWTAVLGSGTVVSTSAYWSDVVVTSAGVVYATLSEYAVGGAYNATGAGMYRSPDGLTWTSITPAGWPTNYNRIVLGAAPSNESVVYFLAETPGGGIYNANDDEYISLWKYSYLSGNGSGSGGIWTDRSANIPLLGAPVGDFNSQGSYDLIVKVKSNDSNAVFIGGTNLYRSTDGFATTGATTWVGGYATANDISRYLNHHPDQHSLAFLPSNASVLFSGQDGGITKTTDCLATPVVWSSLNIGYLTTQFYTVGVYQARSGNVAVGGGMQDNGTWGSIVNATITDWDELNSGDGSYFALASTTNSMYVSSQNGVTYRYNVDTLWNVLSTPYYTRVDPVRPGGAIAYRFINPYILDKNNEDLMYFAGGDRVWRNSALTGIAMGSTSPTSTNWTELSGTATGTVSSLAVSQSNPTNRLFVGTSSRTILRVDNAHTGTPTGVDISSVSMPTGNVSCIAVDPSDGNRIIVTYSNYSVPSVWYTTNANSATPTWVDISGNLEENSDGTGNGPSARWAEIVPAGGSYAYFVGTSVGLYATTTLNGASTVWIKQGGSVIGNVVVNSMTSRPSDGYLAVATHGNGVFTTTVTSAGLVSVHDQEAAAVQSFRLAQNYPNPFNPSTIISYYLPSSERVSLKVYDAAGREVATVVDADQSAGPHQATFNAGRLASGAYVYRIVAGEFSQSRKMVFMK